jgi:transposase
MELAQAERQLNLTEHKRLKLLELENSELKRANEISLKEAALFAQAEHKHNNVAIGIWKTFNKS